ncbi:hypothetical protein EC973_002001 [Apophysomyces ossiformis]|uniref:OTU domain-containing protein n=1 Tax=Apophysomyces ossiformis TaxID=679940 RepID=A0A8H7BJ14_9FUNG|nr:hypothetical protein EC973_002001 [Apophysomyces ossiformis]
MAEVLCSETGTTKWDGCITAVEDEVPLCFVESAMGTNKASHIKGQYDETKIYRKAYDLASSGRDEQTPIHVIRSEEKQIRRDSRKNNTSSDETYDNNLVKRALNQTADFHINTDIPRSSFTNVIDVKADGWCGFRVLAHVFKDDENKFLQVKQDMLSCLAENADIYRNYFPSIGSVEKLQELISHGIDVFLSVNGQHLPCKNIEYWFTAPECVQLAADTYRGPIAVYSDDETTDAKGNLVYPSLLYLPVRGPLPRQKPLTVILHHVDGNHWITLNMKRGIKLKWPRIE